MNRPFSEFPSTTEDIWPENMRSETASGEPSFPDQPILPLAESGFFEPESSTQRDLERPYQENSRVPLQEATERLYISEGGGFLQETSSTAQSPAGDQLRSPSFSDLDNQRLRRSLRQTRGQNTHLREERDAARGRLDQARARAESLEQLLEDVMYRDGMSSDARQHLLRISSALADLKHTMG